MNQRRVLRDIVRSSHLLAAAVALALPALARSADITYTGPDDGNWNKPSNWSANAVPRIDDHAILPGRVTSYTVRYDGAYSAPGLAFLTIDGGFYPALPFHSTSTTLLQDSYSLASNYEDIGMNGPGTGIHTQSGGANTVTWLRLGDNEAAGIYNLSDNGKLITQSVHLGAVDSSGTFNQTGGSHTIANDLLIAAGGNSTATYNMSGGKLTLNSETMAVVVGNQGTGVFNHSDGDVVITTLGWDIGRNAAGVGTYNLSDTATLTQGGDCYLGRIGKGTFNQVGGSHRINGTLFLAYQAGAQGTYNLQSGTLTVATIEIRSNGLFKQTLGALEAGVINQVGGKVEGTLQNQGTFNYTSGTFAGRLWNQGIVNLGPNFTAANGIRNDSSLSIGYDETVAALGNGLDNRGTLTLAGGTLTLSTNATNVNSGNFLLHSTIPFSLGNATLSNSGAINLRGGVLAGPGTLRNTLGGTLFGQGLITATLINDGNLVVSSAATHIANPFTNSGVIRLTSDTATLAGGQITNAGIIQGAGSISSAIVQKSGASIEPLSGALLLGASLVNEAGALVSIPSGAKLIASAFPANAGAISLTGGTLDTNNQPLANAGLITGYGTLRTGPLTNNASILLTGGFSTIDSPVTNAAGKKISIRHNAALFNAPVTNNGTIELVNATATFAAGGSGLPAGSLAAFAVPDQPSLAGAGSISVDSSSTLIADSLHQAALVNAGSVQLRPGGGVSILSSLDLTGRLDLGGNSLILRSANLPQLVDRLRAGRLYSSSAPPFAGLGMIANNRGNDLPLYQVFEDQPVAATNFLLKETFLGDANLDGHVDADDYFRIDRGRTTQAPGWYNGDFNYDAAVGADDYQLIDLGFLAQATPLSMPAPVPEPATLLLPALSAACLLLPRRRQNRY